MQAFDHSVSSLAALVLLPAFGPPSAAVDGNGAVYVASNDLTSNEVLAFPRRSDGRLDSPSSFATGGAGTGEGLGNQGGLILTDDERFLLVVNANSNEISVLIVGPQELELRDVAASGGLRPISLALHDDLLYVLHAGGLEGGSDRIVGFRLQPDGHLEPIPGAIRALSAASTDPAQVGFTPDGSALVVTEKATNTITTYLVGDDGIAGLPAPQPSAGMTPFGFAFGKRRLLFVSEAFGGAIDQSALSSYVVRASGMLDLRAPSVRTTETAACWVAVSPGGRFAYATNTGSDTISGFEVGFEGRLGRLALDGVTTATGAAPIDLDFSSDGRFLYALGSGDGSLSGFRFLGASGRLVEIDVAGGLPPSSNGLAAR